jgi:DNA mismatch endonuclease (patch repair protein)
MAQGSGVVPDIVDAATRSRMMAGIRDRNTRPETIIRKALHARGFRYRLHSRAIPGRPDFALPRYRAAVFVNGCFWHGHNCHLFRLPDTRREFWKLKIDRNCSRDAEVRAALRAAGWRSLTVWECAIRGRGAFGLDVVADEATNWIRTGAGDHEIRGAF